VVLEKNIVAIRPQPRLASNERPDFSKGRTPRRGNSTRGDLAPHRGQLAGLNREHVDGDGHSPILSQSRAAGIS
jgi:hypothetical protein